MDDMKEQHTGTDGLGPAAIPPADTIQALLSRLTSWKRLADKYLNSQMTVLEAMERFALTELRTHFPEGNIDQHFVHTLLDAVMQQIIDRQPLAFDPEQDALYRWPDAHQQAFTPGRREAVSRTVNAVALSFLDRYRRYLREHWTPTGRDEPFDRLMARKLKRYLAGLDKVFDSDRLAGLTVDQLRGEIERVQEINVQRYQLTALATASERLALDAIALSQMPHWLRVLGEPERARLRDYQEQASMAKASVDELLDGIDSLEGYARQQASDYIRLKLDIDVEPDKVEVQVQWQTVVGQPRKTSTLSELLAAGPLDQTFATVIKVSGGNSLRHSPLTTGFIREMLSYVDCPASYLQALVSNYGRKDVKAAMVDWYSARLQHSAYMARCAGHINVADHHALQALWDSDASTPGLRVAGLALPNTMKCADLLVFFREDATGAVDDLLLYAPNKPDEQEWVRLPSLRALSQEVGGWIRDEAGREYLLQQLHPVDRHGARAFFAAVHAKPVGWDMNRDLRHTAGGYVDGLGNAVSMGMANHLAQVGQQDSPGWYSTLALDRRRIFSSVNQQLIVHQQVFENLLAGYEVFADFARRTVTQAIKPYLLDKGVQEAVDPTTILIDYSPGIADGNTRVASLLDLAIYGYEENAGIDHPDKGVRSSIGQDLSRVRSADLARYIRSAYLGEKYANEIRHLFLNARQPQYEARRYAYRNVLLTKMDRDLRVATSQAHLDNEAYTLLVQQITRLGLYPSAPDAATKRAAERDGVFKFTVRGEVVLGVYVFAFFNPRHPSWLYTPDAPDGVAFRKYERFAGPTATQLHDYVASRVKISAKEKVERSLRALAAKNMTVDTLFELQRVNDPDAEFDAYIERSVTDVEDVTTRRSEMIKNQVFKGLMFASIPFCIVFPPFALFLDAVFVAISASQAIQAHGEGDTDAALDHWLEASWGALLGVAGTRGASRLLGRALKRVKPLLKPASLTSRRLASATSAAAGEASPVVRPIRFKPKQAVSETPDNLQWITEAGLFQGTYRSAPSATTPQPRYYIRSKGKYYQVMQDPHFGGLCLVDASRPSAIYKQPVRLKPDGKWVPDKVGLRGGNRHVRNLGRVDTLHDAFPGGVEPNVMRGALQGEAVVAGFRAGAADNYLFSLNAQTCVIASLYNPVTRMGAVIHFDHNIRALIERSVSTVMQRLGGRAGDIRTTLVGGDWLTGTDIGGRVRSVMRAKGLQPNWDFWSYSSCLGNNFAVSLDLATGVTTVFKTSIGQVERFYTPFLRRAKQGTDAVSVRVNAFMKRVRAKPLEEDASGVVVDKSGRPATAEDTALQGFSMVLLT